MNESNSVDHAATYLVGVSTPSVIPRFSEYVYLGLLCYALLSEVVGISVPLGPAVALLALAVYFVWRLRKSGVSFRPVFLPLGCAVSFLVVQIVFHDASILDDSLRSFVTWIFSLIIIRSLCLREGFFHRFAFATLGMSALLLPFLNLAYNSSTERAGLDRSIAVANPNDLAAWFGFCCIYCTIVAIETRRNVVRLASLAMAAGCLFIVGLTVSRGPVMAIAIAATIGGRRLLKRGFAPVMVVLIVGSVLVLSGIFDQSIGHYEERGNEETGRLLVWPLAFERFLDSPVIGVGAAKSETYVPIMGQSITPHNGFLYVALASGIIPFALFVAYWITAGRYAYLSSSRHLPETPFLLPLFIYALIMCSLSAGQFFFPWVSVTLLFGMSAGVPGRARHRILQRIGRSKTAMYPRSQTRTVGAREYYIRHS